MRAQICAQLGAAPAAPGRELCARDGHYDGCNRRGWHREWRLEWREKRSYINNGKLGRILRRKKRVENSNRTITKPESPSEGEQWRPR